MDAGDIAKQTQVERQMLSHIEQALRVALDWEVRPDNFSRNLSTLRFVGQSFQRHLDRAWALQHHGGYMRVILEVKPHLEKQVTALRHNHSTLQSQLDQVLCDLENIPAGDVGSYDAVRQDLLGFLDDLKQHHQQETQLYQDAFMQEEGGEA